MSHLIDLGAAGLLVCGFGYVSWVYYRQLMLRRSHDWPSTTGTIVRPKIARRSSLTDSHTPNHAAGSRIEYNYMVGNRVYRGNTICIGGSVTFFSGKHTEDQLGSYQLGASVPVYFDPAHPEISCLEHCRENPLFGYLVGGGAALFGLLLLLGVIHLD